MVCPDRRFQRRVARRRRLDQQRNFAGFFDRALPTIDRAAGRKNIDAGGQPLFDEQRGERPGGGFVRQIGQHDQGVAGGVAAHRAILPRLLQSMRGSSSVTTSPPAGSFEIVPPAAERNIDHLAAEARRWFSCDYFDVSQELGYRDIPRRLLTEPLLLSPSGGSVMEASVLFSTAMPT